MVPRTACAPSLGATTALATTITATAPALKIANSVSAGQNGLKWEGYFSLSGVAKPGTTPEVVEQALYREIEKLQQGKVDERELQKIKNQFAADNVAMVVSDGVGRRYRAVEDMARSTAVRQEFVRTVSDPAVIALLDRLDQPRLDQKERSRLLEEFRQNAERKRLQAALEAARPWLGASFKVVCGEAPPLSRTLYECHVLFTNGAFITAQRLQELAMADVELVTGHIEARAEGAHNVWQTPTVGDLHVATGYVEMKYSLPFGAFAAGREQEALGLIRPAPTAVPEESELPDPLRVRRRRRTRPLRSRSRHLWRRPGNPPRARSSPGPSLRSWTTSSTAPGSATRCIRPSRTSRSGR